MSQKEILETAHNYGYQELVLTDINNTSACLDFIRLAPNHQIKPIVGVDFRNDMQQCYVGIAKNNNGFKNINTFLTSHLHDNSPFPEKAPPLEDVFFVYPFRSYENQQLSENEYLGISPQDLPRLRFSKIKYDPKKALAMPTCTFIKKHHHFTHTLLRAIEYNTILTKLESKNIAEEVDVFPKLFQLNSKYEDYPQLLQNTRNIIDQCEIKFSFKDPESHENQKVFTDSKENDLALLISECEKGLKQRYPNPTQEIRERLNKELDLIQKKNFVAYFLINWDIVSYARSKDYYYVGRGSGANSIVAYLLHITDVDPIELDLYFERFMNLYRQNPPDFDIDFSWKDRDAMTKYIFTKYPKSALIGTYNTFTFRAAVRELGKVFGLTKHDLDLLSRGKTPYNQLDSNCQRIINYSKLLENFPSHLSVHASGIVIPDRDIAYFGATFLPPKGYPTTQFSMLEAEDVGLCKFDILSQRGLGKIKDCLDIIKYNQPQNPPKNIRQVDAFFKDPKVNTLLREARAIGCFYVESPAMRMLLAKLKTDNYLGLVAASSIIRPGVAKSGMMREYILRTRDPSRCKDAHPIMLQIMPETYGIMVYQEDVIKVAHEFAGLTLAESDELRRGMSGKYRSREEFMKVKERYFDNCRAKGIEDERAKEVWDQIESFAGYAFSKGHSASYAIESYQCLYLKTYYPLEYMVATLNNFGGFYRPEFYIHEARMHGAIIHAPCLNNSLNMVYLKNKEIYLGLAFIQGITTEAIDLILSERLKNGVFLSFEDFIDRVPISHDQITLLIRINAFRFTGVNKRELLWRTHSILSGKKRVVSATQNLFKPQQKNYKIPELEFDKLQESFDQMELLGYPMCSPFSLVKDQDYQRVNSKDLRTHLHKTITIRGYLVTTKRTRTGSGDEMNFGTFLDEEGQFLDTVHFPPTLKKFPFRGRGVYQIQGKVVEEFGYYSIEVSKQEKLMYDTVE